MDALIDKIREGRFWDFPGGVFPPERKAMSNQAPIRLLPLPEKLYITVKQHIGVEGHVRVQEGERVLKGQPLTQAMNPFAVPVHAPTSGTVTAIGPHVAAHPSGLEDLTIELTPDGKDQWCELTTLPDYQQRPKSEVIEAISRAGISGMGGAGFPTHIKVSPKKNVDFLIINGVECEPYITSDDMLMREHAWQIRQGIDVMTHLLTPKYVLIAIEDNKPEAIKAMKVACQENPNYVVCSVPTKYPAGGEKQLIQVLTGREVPSKGLPIDAGVIMQNVGTCYAVADAIFTGRPLIQRVVTVTGEALKQPQNAWALLGTPAGHLLQQAGYQSERQQQKNWIMGGPMMGFNLVDEQTPVVKITNCLLAPDDKLMPELNDEQPCIRCSACADACPASLLPQQLYWHSKAKELDKAQDYNLFDCIECGACAYVCPSQIPLVHYYRVAKAEIRTQEEEKEKADRARDRFEARKERLEQEKQEREEKHRRAAEARRKAKEARGEEDPAQAAVARAKARKSGDGDAKAGVAAAIARAKAKKQQAEGESTSTADNASTQAPDKKDKVQAAIARAKAKKAQQQSSVSEPNDGENKTATDDAKQDKVKAAIARAKAKQQAKRSESEAQPREDKQADLSKEDKVKAAVARAKAKQQAKQSESEAQPQEDKQADLSKEEKVKAAVARAKAKKQAREQKDNDQS
ncbi:Electron transport complex subunit [Saliniradius amylolyticus]|uniref:Ion-translocating oxidoreductase complex subunit C n=1 Tax=Saliniradius amylolyticus TaxID=2183582 RepID=A0A2S2E1D4_9ALTE|nr:electron transport complex subunit RsxC [Saliniradius amylolyticus]AWL11436.1 Electron transport complex subunit [Saliniradius amylolyticus]